MKSSFIAVVITVFTLALPCLVSAESVMSEIDAANKAFAKANMAGDVEYLVNDYTDEGCIIAPQTAKTCGSEAIRAFWEAVVASKPRSVELITHTAEQASNVAYSTGQLRITDAESTVHESQFVLVFKKVDGAWKLHIDSWTPR